MLQVVERNAKAAAKLPSGELSWFASRVEQGKKAPFSEIATITPEVARHILDNNEDNRKLRKTLIESIANDIRNGFWVLNGESIIIAKDGTLNDGQHRLNAVIEANKPIETVMMFGVSRDSRLTVDMGAARTAGDFLGMRGVKYRNEAAAVARLYYGFRNDIYHIDSAALTKQMICDEYRKHAKKIDKGIDTVAGTSFTKMAGMSSVGTAAVILAETNPEQAAFFLSRMFDGTHLKRGDAILKLRNHFMELQGKRLKPSQKLELILRYWNAWRQGRSVSSAIAIRGTYPKVEK